MKHSLLLTFGIVIGILFVISVSGMLCSVIISKTATGYAAAINQAGTLGMQAYRITRSLVQGSAFENESSAKRTADLVKEYNQHLYSPRIQSVLSKGPHGPVIDTYRQVELQWKQTILPNLENYLIYQRTKPLSPSDRQTIASFQRKHLLLVDDFVEDIHRFVEALETDAVNKNEQLRTLQIVLLSLTLLLAIISLYLIKRLILEPLNELLVCASAARHGDFSVRSRILNENELGQLGQAFNVMAEALSNTDGDLEARVQEKTLDLERSNRTLELLYSTTKRLSNYNLSEEVLEAVTQDIETLMDVENCTICLGQPDDAQAFRYASTSHKHHVISQLRERQCALCLDQGDSHTFKLESGDQGIPVNIFSTPIRDKAQQCGVLLIEFAADQQLEPWQETLLETVAGHIAQAFNVAQQASESRRLSLLEERSVIARELHDSIAQSLSYLKVQVSRLEQAVAADVEKAQLLRLIDVLRSALNDAYRQLRELLMTFRLPINETNLGEAIETTVDEFAKTSGMPIDYVNEIGNCQFTPNAEIHVIHIIREALTNIIRHANASRASVKLNCDADGQVNVIVEDNGIGISDPNDMLQHYGLPIMKERAEWINGNLRVTQPSSGGTQISLTFNVNESPPNESKKNLIELLKHA